MPEIKERIRLLEEQVESLSDDLRVLRTLVEHDHASALNKIRYITEKVLHRLCADNDISWGKAHPTLERMLGPLIANEVIPRNVGIHVRTIQTNASPGSHYQESALTSTHVHIAQVALVDFLEWEAREGLSDASASSADIPARTPSAGPRISSKTALAMGVVSSIAAIVIGVLVWQEQSRSDPTTDPTTDPNEVSVAETEDAGGEPDDAGAAEPATPTMPVATDGFQIGEPVTLVEAAMLWRRLQRHGRPEGIVFVRTGEERYAVVASDGESTGEEAAELAEAVGLEVSGHESAASDRLVPGYARATTGLNVRTGPGTEHPMVRIIADHTIVVAIQGRVDGFESAAGDEGFQYVVATAEHSGWCAARFLVPDHRCLPPPDAFLGEAPAARAEALERDLTYARVHILAPAGSGDGFVLLARDREIGRSHVGVFLERGECHLERQFFSTIDGIVESVSVIETEPHGSGETLLMTESHISLELGPDGRETWHAYRLTSTDPVWALDAPTFANSPRRRRTMLIWRATRAGSVRGYWPVEVRHRGGGGTDYYRWDGTRLVLDTAVSQSASDAP